MNSSAAVLLESDIPGSQYNSTHKLQRVQHFVHYFCCRTVIYTRYGVLTNSIDTAPVY